MGTEGRNKQLFVEGARCLDSDRSMASVKGDKGQKRAQCGPGARLCAQHVCFLSQLSQR